MFDVVVKQVMCFMWLFSDVRMLRIKTEYFCCHFVAAKFFKQKQRICLIRSNPCLLSKIALFCSRFVLN